MIKRPSKVVIVDSFRRLKKYLAQGHSGQGDLKYISLAEYDIDAVDLLSRNGFTDARRTGTRQRNGDVFMKAYLDLIGLLSAANHGRLWWATDMASKNRFTCKLPDHLEQFVETTDIIKASDYDLLVVYCPAWSIIGSLKDILRAHKISFEVQVDGFSLAFFRHYKRLRRSVGVLYYAMRIYFRGVLARVVLREQIASFRGEKGSRYVVKTFIYPSSFKGGKYGDAFFGRLIEYLQGRERVLILGDIIGDYAFCLQKISENRSLAILPWEIFISFKDILTAVIEIFCAHFTVDPDTLFMGQPVSSIIQYDLYQTFNGIQVSQLLFYPAIKRMAQETTIGTFLMTFENNPWERMCSLALKEQAPVATVIGYQHATVSLASLNLFLSPRERSLAPLPQKIGTVGLVSYRLLERYGGYDDGCLMTTCALRYEYLKRGDVGPKPTTLRHVFVPLGGTHEVHAMIRYLLGQIGKDPDYEVLIRPHPILRWEKFIKEFKFEFEKYPSVSISKGRSLLEDLRWADVVVYWETAVALEAVCLGKPVIHFDRGDVLSFDPLFELKDLKWAVTSQGSFAEVLDKINSVSQEEFTILRTRSSKHMGEYFHAVIPQRMELFRDLDKKMIDSLRNDI